VYRELNHDRDVTEAVLTFGKIVKDIFQESMIEYTGVSSITTNIRRVSRLLGLSTAESRLIELNLLLSIDIRSIIFRDFLFSVIKNPSMFEFIYRTMLNTPEGTAYDYFGETYPSEIDAALTPTSTPIAVGMVSYDRKTKKISTMTEFWVFALSRYVDEEDSFFKQFVSPIKEKKRSFSGAIAKINSEKDLAMVTEFIRKAAVKLYDQKRLAEIDKTEPLTGMNLLFYGSRNLDTIGYVYNLIKSNGLKGYQVNCGDARPSDVPAICLIAQKYLDRINDGTSILVIDRTEHALTKRFNRPAWMLDMFGDDAPNEHDSDQLDSDERLLINNPVPTIWLTNSVSSITPENVGRFLFHIELKGGSRKDRREEVQKICDELGFSHEIAQQLSMYYELNTEQIKSAAQTTTFLEKAGTEGEQTLVHLITNSQKALDRERTEQLRASVTHYDTSLLNLSGTMSPDKIIAALKLRPVGTLCFYGLPGTGKTALAEHIAMQLDMPIMIKPASELLSMWLGESEKNIAKMFDDAKAEGSILLLDEADSFLRDRSQAQRSWEVTQVNELLQRMERFPGIFICTTNLFQAIDAAALRRFTFKLEFLALTPAQRMQMLANEAGIDLNTLSTTEREALEIDCQMIRYLTPGDFATVKRQANLLGEKLSVAEWLRRLEMESRAKLVGIERNSYGEEYRTPEVTPRKRGE
jgi:DNA replication protein DnaC